MISYKPLLKMLIDKNLKKTDLIDIAELSKATVSKLAKNQHVSLDVIERLCAALDCQPGELIEYIPDK